MTPFAIFSIMMTLIGALFGWQANESYHKKQSDKKKKIEDDYQKRVINAYYGCSGGWTHIKKEK